jgi:hypothetical protein
MPEAVTGKRGVGKIEKVKVLILHFSEASRASLN